MDQALLEVFGKAAGIGGLAMGVFLLIFRSVIRKNIFPKLSNEHAFRLIRLILVFTFLIAALGIGAWVYASVGSKANHGAVDESEVRQAFQQVGGTGWILLGNYESDNNRWTYGPFFSYLQSNRDDTSAFPPIGASIRLTATRRVVILDWRTKKWDRRLDRPGLDKAVLVETDDITPVTLGAGALLDVGDISAGHFPGRQDVVWVRVIPMVH